MLFVMSLLAGPMLVQLLFVGHAAVRWAAAKRLELAIARVRVGWGPKLWSHNTQGGEAIEVRLLPPLAMVAIRGHDRSAEDVSYRALYGRSDLGKRVLLTLATPAYYVALAVLPLFAVGLIAGWPETTTPSPMIVGQVEPGSPAEEAGIERGDTILLANGQRIDDVQGLIEVVSSRAGRSTSIILLRAGRVRTMSVTPIALAGEQRARIGLVPKTTRVWKPLGVLDAAANAFTFPAKLFAEQVTGLLRLLQPQERQMLVGPVGKLTPVAESERISKPERALLVLTMDLLMFWLMLCLPLPFCPFGRLLLLIPEALGRAQPSLGTERWLTRLTLGGYAVLIAVVIVSDIAGRLR